MRVSTILATFAVVLTFAGAASAQKNENKAAGCVTADNTRSTSGQATAQKTGGGGTDNPMPHAQQTAGGGGGGGTDNPMPGAQRAAGGGTDNPMPHAQRTTAANPC